MSGAEPSFGLWLLRSALGGGLILLFACIALRYVRQPARRQRLGEMAMAAALLVAILSLAPSWLLFSVPAGSLPIAEHSSSADSPLPSHYLPSEDLFALVPGIEEAPAAPVSYTSDQLSLVDSSNAAEPFYRAVPWLFFLGIAYGLGAAFILTRWLIGYVGLWRLVRTAEPASPRVARVFATMSAEPHRPRLLIAR